MLPGSADTARLKGRFSQAPRGNKWVIALGVVAALGISGERPLWGCCSRGPTQLSAAFRRAVPPLLPVPTSVSARCCCLQGCR